MYVIFFEVSASGISDLFQVAVVKRRKKFKTIPEGRRNPGLHPTLSTFLAFLGSHHRFRFERKRKLNS